MYYIKILLSFLCSFVKICENLFDSKTYLIRMKCQKLKKSCLCNCCPNSSEILYQFVYFTASLHSSTSLMGYNTTPHPLTGKDRTVLVTLIVMGVIVPSVFIFVIVSICCRQRKMVQKRR